MPTDDFQASEWTSAKRVLARRAPPEHVEAALLRAFTRRHAPLPWYRRLGTPTLLSGLGLAAVGCIALLMATLFRPVMTPLAPATLAVADLKDQGFVLLVDNQQMTMPPNVQLLHAELPRHVLAALGVHLDAGIADDMVPADLMVTASGQPVAIRLAFN